MVKKVVKIKPIKIFTRTIFCGEELNFQLRFNLLPSTTPILPIKGKGGGLGPLSTNRVEVGGQEKNGPRHNLQRRLEDKRTRKSRHIEAGKKKIPFNDTNLLES